MSLSGPSGGAALEGKFTSWVLKWKGTTGAISTGNWFFAAYFDEAKGFVFLYGQFNHFIGLRLSDGAVVFDLNADSPGPTGVWSGSSVLGKYCVAADTNNQFLDVFSNGVLIFSHDTYPDTANFGIRGPYMSPSGKYIVAMNRDDFKPILYQGQ